MRPGSPPEGLIDRSWVVLSRHHWPMCMDRTGRLLRWAGDLRGDGLEFVFLSPSWHASWPSRCWIRELRLERLGLASGKAGAWERWLQGAFDWIASQSSRVAGILIDDPYLSLPEAAPLLSRWRGRWIARFQLEEGISEPPHQDPRNRRMIEAMGHASAIVVPDARSHRHLIAHGIRDERIRRLPDVSRLQIDRHPQHIRSIRHALGRINQELMVPPAHRLLVAWSDFLDITEEKRVALAVGELVDRRYPLRMWWLGNGPRAAAFHRWIKDEGWQHEILLPGVLDHPEDLLTAADLVLFAGGPGRWTALCREAMASAVPWMADHQFHAALDTPAAEFCFFSERSLGDRLRQWLEDPASHQQQVDHSARELRIRDAEGSVDQQWRQLLMQ